MSQDQKLPIVDPLSTSVAIQPPPSQVIERKVYIRVVENVEEHDYPQALKTWQALEQAGINPGDLVANALEQGHNYASSQVVVTQPIFEKSWQPIAENLTEGTRLISYQYVTDEKLLAASPQASAPGVGMEIVLTSKQLTVADSDQRSKALKMVAVLRKKLPDLLK